MNRSRFLELGRELKRLVYVPIATVLLVLLAANLVFRSSLLAKQLPEALNQKLPSLMTWSGGATAILAFVAATAAIGLLLSIPEQLSDLSEYKKNLSPALPQEAAATQNLLKARHLFLWLSLLAFVVAVALLIWISLPSPPLIGAAFPAPVVHDFLAQLPALGPLIILLILAFALKRMFVDYIADIALYTTADENSAFFATRANILKEATSRLRDLLRDRDLQYTSVAIAGHSLGSVIAYDAINLLRTEAQYYDGLDADAVARSRTVPINKEQFAKLATLITFGSPLNKVLYFFRSRTKVQETLRRHIIQEQRGFRLVEDLLAQDSLIDPSKATAIPDDLHWVNCYSPMDPVSAPLVFYKNVDEHSLWYARLGFCHTSYWSDPKFFKWVLTALLPKKAQG